MKKLTRIFTLAMAVFFALAVLFVASACTSSTGGDTSPVVTSCTITFDSRNATTLASPATVTIIPPSTNLVSLPTPPEKTDYEFSGWFTEPYGEGTVFTESTPITRSITVYAQWSHSSLLTLSDESRTEVAMGSVASLDTAGFLRSRTNTVYTQATSTTAGFAHKISPFSIGANEVTYELWYLVRSWAVTNGYTFANAGREGHDAYVGVAPSTSGKLEPVTTINWRDAIVWCNAYSEMAGKSPSYYSDASCSTVLKTSTNSLTVTAEAQGSQDAPYVKTGANGYRLPTEGEWQYAASCAARYPYDFASGSDAAVGVTASGDVDGDGNVYSD